MTLSFINDITREKLKADILWYVTNAQCAIGGDLISSKAVCLVVAKRTKSLANLQPLASSQQDSTAEDNEPVSPQRVMTQNGLLFIRPTKNQGPLKTITQVNENQYVMPEMYELKRIERWLEKSRQDPISKQKVIALKEYNLNPADTMDANNALYRLTNFINLYLETLQIYISEGNLVEIEHWLKIWHELKEENPDLYHLQNPNIILPNRKSLTTQAYDSAQHELLKLLKDRYELVYTPTRYQSFINYLNAVAAIPDISDAMCDQLYQEHIGIHLINSFEPFLRSSLVTQDSVIAENASKHLNMYPLQIACEVNNLPAVKQLIRAEASLGPIEYNNSNHEGCVSPNECELIMAINADSLEMFAVLRPLFLARNTLAIMAYATHHIIHHDKPEFLRSLIDEYGIKQSLSAMLFTAICHLSEECLDFLLERYKNELENASIKYFDFLPQDQFDPRLQTAPKFVNIMSKLLPYTSSIIGSLSPRFSPSFSEEFHTKIRTALMANDLLIEIFRQRDAYILDGTIDPMPSEVSHKLQHRIYMVLFANMQSILTIKEQGKQQQLVTALALGNLKNGDFNKSKIQLLIQNLVNTTSPSKRSKFRCVLM